MIVREVHCRASRIASRAAARNLRHASTTVSTATAPGSPLDDSSAPIQRYPPTQPPSLKPPSMRKSQLHRQYTSLLQSTPLMLVFQHYNLKASEWAGIRRELDLAIRRADAAAGGLNILENRPRIRVITPGIFNAALRVVEHFQPASNSTEPVHAASQQTQSHTHFLSQSAYEATRVTSGNGSAKKKPTSLEPLMTGPVAILSFPSLSPAQLATALRILAPTQGSSSAFPAPKRRDAPGLYDPLVQTGLQKIVLLGARVEGKAFDHEGVKWVGSLAGRGGLEGMRAEVVGLLQSIGMGLVSGLDRIGLGVWGTLESRRQSLEDGEKKE